MASFNKYSLFYQDQKIMTRQVIVLTDGWVALLGI